MIIAFGIPNPIDWAVGQAQGFGTWVNEAIFYPITGAVVGNSGGDGSVGLGDAIGALTDPIVPDYVYKPRAGLEPGFALPGRIPYTVADPDDRTGWFPQGAIPDAWEDPLKKGLIIAAIAAALLIGGRE